MGRRWRPFFARYPEGRIEPEIQMETRLMPKLRPPPTTLLDAYRGDDFRVFERGEEPFDRVSREGRVGVDRHNE